MCPQCLPVPRSWSLSDCFSLSPCLCADTCIKNASIAPIEGPRPRSSDRGCRCCRRFDASGPLQAGQRCTLIRRVGKLQPLESRRDACEPDRIKCHVRRRDGRRGAGAQRGRTAEKNSRESLCRTPAAAVACDLRRLLSCHVIPVRVAAHGTGNSRAYAARRGRGFGEGQESSV